MPKDDSTINPKPIISLMFAITVGFWASQLAQYVSPLNKAERLHDTIAEVQVRINDDLSQFVSNVGVSLKSDAEQLQKDAVDALDKYVNLPMGDTHNAAKKLETTITEIVNKNTALVEAEKWSDLQKTIDKRLEKHARDMEPINRKTQWWVTLISGMLFLGDLLCIVWWYARYIYRAQPKVSFKTYFLDFIICSMFALAANSWTKPTTFLFATIVATTFLLCRFCMLYFSSDASQTDKRILRIAGIALAISLPIATSLLFGFDSYITVGYDISIFGSALPGVLSLIGIILTWGLKNKIDIAVAIYLTSQAPITPAHLVWPSRIEDSDELREKDQRDRIRHRAHDGLDNFDELFKNAGKYDRIFSRVHSETELRVQSYILAMPSCEKEKFAEEIEKKAFMVAVSHWLDDLVDGRNELLVYDQLEKFKKLQQGTTLSDKEEEARKLFEYVYRPLIVKYTDRNFFEHLYNKICDSCSLGHNLKYMLLGLNRVAYGAVIFSPKVGSTKRKRVLEDHNKFLKDWNDENKGPFERKIEDLIDEIAADEEAGPVLLGLTTKTVQEVALSSEKNELDIGLSILLSILYAPLIYYHNYIEELKNNEMVPLQSFDTDSYLWIPWLKKAGKIIDDFSEKDERNHLRTEQIEMVYKSFAPMLRKPIRQKLYDMYV